MEETSKNNETAQLGIGGVIERNFTTKEVVALFQKLEEERSHYYPEDACDILPLNEFLKSEGLI